MTITVDIREQVRQRANFACEFCGVTEIMRNFEQDCGKGEQDIFSWANAND